MWPATVRNVLVNEFQVNYITQFASQKEKESTTTLSFKQEEKKLRQNEQIKEHMISVLNYSN